MESDFIYTMCLECGISNLYKDIILKIVINLCETVDVVCLIMREFNQSFFIHEIFSVSVKYPPLDNLRDSFRPSSSGSLKFENIFNVQVKALQQFKFTLNVVLSESS